MKKSFIFIAILVLAFLVGFFRFGSNVAYASGITHVQGNCKDVDTSLTNFSDTLTSTPLTGDLLTLIFGSRDFDTSDYHYCEVLNVSESGVSWMIANETDTLGGVHVASQQNEWLIRVGPTSYYYSLDSEIWFGKVGANPSKTVIINMTGAVSGDVVGEAADIDEYSGVAVLDVVNSYSGWVGSGYPQPDILPSLQATSEASELWVCGFTTNVNAQSAPFNFTVPGSSSTFEDGLVSNSIALGDMYQVSSATGGVGCNDTASSGYWCGCIVTFGAFSVNVQTLDVDGNILTGASVYMSNGTLSGIPTGLSPGTGFAVVGSAASLWFQTYTSQGWANYTGMTNSSVYFYVEWYGLQVCPLTLVSVTANVNVNLTCQCYPFIVNGLMFWTASNATITSASSTSNVLSVSFSSALNNYLLVSSCPIIPRYILNVTYDESVSFANGYLALMNYANATLTIDYESWGTLYVAASTLPLLSCSIVGGDLQAVPENVSGAIATLSVYCGSNGNPTVTTGFTTGTFINQIYSGTYVSDGQTLILGWSATSGSSTGGNNGITGTSPSFVVEIVFNFPSQAFQGQVVNGTLFVSWQGYAEIYIWQIVCGQGYNGWVVNLGALPRALQTSAYSGNATLPISLAVPASLADGSYQVPCSVTFQSATGDAKTVGSTISLTVGPLAASFSVANVPALFMLIALGSFGVFFVSLFVRKRSRAERSGTF